MWQSSPSRSGSRALQSLREKLLLPSDIFLAPSGAQGVTASVFPSGTKYYESLSMSLRSLSCLPKVSLRSVSGLIRPSFLAFLAYFVGQTEPKILCLVVESLENVLNTPFSVASVLHVLIPSPIITEFDFVMLFKYVLAPGLSSLMIANTIKTFCPINFSQR